MTDARQRIALGIELKVMRTFMKQQGFQPGCCGKVVGKQTSADEIDLHIERNLCRKGVGNLVFGRGEPLIERIVQSVAEELFVL